MRKPVATFAVILIAGMFGGILVTYADPPPHQDNPPTQWQKEKLWWYNAAQKVLYNNNPARPVTYGPDDPRNPNMDLHIGSFTTREIEIMSRNPPLIQQCENTLQQDDAQIQDLEAAITSPLKQPESVADLEGNKAQVSEFLRTLQQHDGDIVNTIYKRMGWPDSDPRVTPLKTALDAERGRVAHLKSDFGKYYSRKIIELSLKHSDEPVPQSLDSFKPIIFLLQTALPTITAGTAKALADAALAKFDPGSAAMQALQSLLDTGKITQEQIMVAAEVISLTIPVSSALLKSAQSN